MANTEQDVAEDMRWTEIEAGFREDAERLAALVVEGKGTDEEAMQIAKRMRSVDEKSLNADY